jgi:hypothetical protein
MKCQKCAKRIVGKHANTKWCNKCRDVLLKHPAGTMTDYQINQVKRLAGTMDRYEIAKAVGVSISNIKRSMPGVSLAFHNKWASNPDLVKKVCAYYGKHGFPKTKKKFPKCNIRSIVERYKLFNPRCIKLTDKQYTELAKMGGLISLRAQAKYLNRPRANGGSIRSLMYKRFPGGLVNLHGVHFNKAKYLAPVIWDNGQPIGLKCPHVITKYWKMNMVKDKCKARLFLWVDIEKNLRPELPEFLKEAIRIQASFQRWLFKCKNPRSSILKMIKERERV